MKPLKLRLKNFIGIRDGLGLSEITLDFSDYHGLVAVIGPNGCGKTTILDNMTAYRIQPFRAAGYSESKFSYYDQTFGDAEKELVWEHNGIRYRSEILIKGTNKTKTTKAFVYVETPDGSIPVTIADGTRSDGKTDTYDACVHSILGTPELFFTAIFAAQERKRLADYKAGDIKLLLSDLLGLDNLLELATRADEHAKEASAKLEAMRDAVTQYDHARGNLLILEDRLQASRRVLGENEAKLGSARQRAQKAAQEVAEIRAKASIRDENRRRRLALEQQVQNLAQDESIALGRLNQAIEEAQKWGRGADIECDIARLRQQVQSLKDRRGGLELRLKSLPNAEEAAAELATAEAEAAAHYQTILECRKVVESLAGAPAELARLRERKINLVASGKDRSAALERIKASAALINRVPCASLQINSECELLADARRAGEQVPTRENDLATLRDECATLNQQIEKASADDAKHAEAAAKLRAAESGRTAIDERVRKARTKQVEAAAAGTLPEEIRHLDEQILALDTQIAEKVMAKDDRAADADEKVAKLRADAGAATDVRATRRAALQSEIAAMAPEQEADGLAAAETEQRAADADLTSIDAAILNAKTAIARDEQDAIRERSAVAAGEEAAKQSSKLADDAAHWRLLAKALGRDGIVALAIDDAGPSISTIANDLLLACYGPRFSTRFDTQSETAKGVLKEDFDIRVFDAERDTEKSVTMTSGGERLWINDALTRSIALFRSQQSGRSYQALFSDEADGGLDPDRKAHYMRMKREVLKIGGYEVEYCITHTPELFAMADAIIDVGKLRAAA